MVRLLYTWLVLGCSILPCTYRVLTPCDLLKDKRLQKMGGWNSGEVPCSSPTVGSFQVTGAPACYPPEKPFLCMSEEESLVGFPEFLQEHRKSMQTPHGIRAPSHRFMRQQCLPSPGDLRD